MPLAAIDTGFGATKAVADNGNRVSFPSVTAPAPARLGFAEARAHYTVSIDGRAILVGEAAMAAGGTRALDDRADRRGNLRDLLLTALYLLGNAGRTVDVALGLPISHFARVEERDALRDACSGLVADVSGVQVRTDRVDVFPQGIGAYFAAAVRDQALTGQTVAMVDVGFWTTDTVVVTPGGHVAQGSWESLPTGMNDVLQHVRRALEGHLGRPVDPLRLERAIVAGAEYRHQGTAIPLQALADEARRTVAGEIVERLHGTWRKHLDAADVVLLAGGGGTVLAEHLAALHATIRMVPSAEWANAEGFLALWE